MGMSLDRKQELEEVFHVFEREFLNSGGRLAAEVFLEQFRRTHPTLQQCFFRLLACLVDDITETPVYIDGRNEGMMDYAKKISELEHSLPLI